MLTSTEKLVAALKEAGAPEALIARAERDEFHDYKSPSATPIADLARELQAAGLDAVRDRALNGDFDATIGESDDWWEQEGRQMAREEGVPTEPFERPAITPDSPLEDKLRAALDDESAPPAIRNLTDIEKAARVADAMESHRRAGPGRRRRFRERGPENPRSKKKRKMARASRRRNRKH